MEKQEGYVRYKQKGEKQWSGRVSREILTPEEIQIRRFQGHVFEEDFSHIPDLEIPKPPKRREKTTLKKSDLEEDVNYIICPDKTCGLFWDDRFRIACESYCPMKEKMKKMIICSSCKEPVYLGHDHSTLLRVDHRCKDGKIAGMFTRMSGKYHILYERPK